MFRTISAIIALAFAVCLVGCSVEQATPQGSSAQDVRTRRCVPTTCAALGYNCGTTDDGCGHTLNCGTCTAPDTCGGYYYNQCGVCQPYTCADLGLTCGTADDGCGNTLTCGAPNCGTPTCTPPMHYCNCPLGSSGCAPQVMSCTNFCA
jgi:hypothetical protein